VTEPRAWVPIDAWFEAHHEHARVVHPTGTWRRCPPEPDDCRRCGAPLQVAHAYAADGEALRHLESFRVCAAGCPDDVRWGEEEP